MRRFEPNRGCVTVLIVILFLTLSACQSPDGPSEESGDDAVGADVSGNATDIAEEWEKSEVDSFSAIEQYSSEPPYSVPNFSERREGPIWEYINDKIAYLGRSALEIVLKTEYQADYRKIGESETLILHDGGLDVQSLMFSDGVWADTSHCTGIWQPPKTPEKSRSLLNIPAKNDKIAIQGMEGAEHETIAFTRSGNTT